MWLGTEKETRKVLVNVTGKRCKKFGRRHQHHQTGSVFKYRKFSHIKTVSTELCKYVVFLRILIAFTDVCVILCGLAEIRELKRKRNVHQGCGKVCSRFADFPSNCI